MLSFTNVCSILENIIVLFLAVSVVCVIVCVATEKSIKIPQKNLYRKRDEHSSWQSSNLLCKWLDMNEWMTTMNDDVMMGAWMYKIVWFKIEASYALWKGNTYCFCNAHYTSYLIIFIYQSNDSSWMITASQIHIFKISFKLYA